MKQDQNQSFLTFVTELKKKKKKQKQEDFPPLENPWLDLGGEG